MQLFSKICDWEEEDAIIYFWSKCRKGCKIS